MSGSRDVSLTIFIISMSGCKSLTSFACRIFCLRKPPGFRLAFDAAENLAASNKKFGIGMENLAAFNAREVKRPAAEERRRVFLCRRTVKVKAKGKVVPTSFLKIEVVRWDGRAEKEEQLVELVDDQSQSSETPFRSKRRRSCLELSIWRKRVVVTSDGPIWSRCSIAPIYPFRPHFQGTLNRKIRGQD